MGALRSPKVPAGGPASSPGGRVGGLGGGQRPNSEMLGAYLSPNPLASASAAQAQFAAAQSGLMAGTPEADAIDKWFEDLQHYEATLEEMAAASLDTNFKEELSAIEQCES